MASFNDCLETLLTENELVYLKTLLRKQNPDIDFKDPAQVLQAIDDGMTDAAIRYYERKRNAVILQKGIDYIDTSKAGEKVALQEMVGYTGKVGSEAPGIVSLDATIRSVATQLWSVMGHKMKGFRPKMAGMFLSPERKKLLLRELHGESTGDADAKVFAEAVAEMFETARKWFNRVGGGIQRLEHYNLPQYHNAQAIKQAGFDEWREFVEDRVSFEKMHAYIPEEKHESLMRSMYDNLESDGTRKLNVSGLLRSGRGVGAKHQHHRILHFESAQAWQEYAERFGRTDNPLEAINNYVEMMSKDIGLMRVFGTKPERTFAALKNYVQKSTGDRLSTNRAQAQFDIITNKSAGTQVKVANVIQAVRNLQTLKLGAAPLSAISDPVFAGITTVINSMKLTRMYKNYFKYLMGIKNLPERRALAARLAIPMDFVVNRSAALFRYGDATGFGATAKLADASVRLSGLNHMTYAAKYAFGLEFMQNMADHMKSAWADLDVGVKGSLKRYGLNEKDWDFVMSSTPYEVDGVKFLDLQNITSQETRDKLSGALTSELMLAVPESTVVTREILGGGRFSNATANEVIKTATVFKTFPVTVAALHFRRMLNMETNMHKLAYGGSLMAFTMFMGGLSFQAREIAAGRKPVSYDNPALWTHALKQAPGLDIFAGFVDPYGGKRADVLLGPVASDIDLLVGDILFGTAQEAASADGKLSEYLAKKGVRVAKRYTPFQFFYNKAILQRYVWDALEKAADPKWASKQRAVRRRLKREGRHSFIQ